MSIPTVAVTCIAYDQNGNPVIGGLFRARLDRTETYNGFVVPEQVTGTADANGVVVLQLWPNALGVAGSSYRITAINPDTRQQYLNTTAVVPNSACNLHEIIVAAPFPPIDASEQALIAAQGALALVTAQAGIATNAATEAEGHADDAQDSATAAQGFADDASASFTDFDKRYLGTKASDPIVDNEGNTLQIGALYYRLETGLRIYDGNIWSAAYISEAGTLTTSDIGITVQAYSENLDDFAAKTAPAGEIVGTTDIQTLSAKSISGSNNTITSIANSSLVNSAVTVNGQTVALGASTTVTATATNPLTIGTGLNGSSYNGSAPVTVSLANTTVTPASYGSASDTLTATVNARGQLTALAATPIAIANTQVSGLGTASVLDAAVALGAATLDASGKVPISQIPSSIQGGVSYQGTWDATTNTPTIVSGTGSKGHYYVVSVGGTTAIDGISDWLPGDWIIFNGTAWEKIDNTDSVISVNGYIGAVSLNAADVGAPPTTRTITAGTGLTGGGDLSANRTIEIDSTVATLTGTQTLTNKTINLTDNTLQATSAQIAAAVTDETGTGALVFANSPTLVTPALGTPASGVVTNLTGTASININGTVGATTANTGAFTTLTTSSTVTLNGGTANGVAFLNASKVLTTGSALTFDGNTLTATNTSGNAIIASRGGKDLRFSGNYAGANTHAVISTTTGMALAFMDESSELMRLTSTGLGIGTSSPANRLHVAGSATTQLQVQMTGQADMRIISDTGYGALSLESNMPLIFRTNATERARIDSSGNFGIGVNPTNAKLEVSASSGEVFRADASGGAFRIVANQTDILLQGSSSIQSWINGSEGMRLTSTGLGIGTSSPTRKLDVVGNIGTSVASGNSAININNSSLTGKSWDLLPNTASGESDLLWYYGGASAGTRMTLTNSGNLGLGVTPGTWSDGKAFEINTAGNSLWGEGNFTILTQNARYNGGYKYARTGVASSHYDLDGGSHKWYTAPSGTAGDAISFSQVMTLDASGALLVGKTSNASYAGKALFGVNGAADNGVVIAQANATGPYLTFFNSSDSGFADISTTGSGVLALRSNSALTFNTGSGLTERARIDSSGNLLVGTTSQLTTEKFGVLTSGATSAVTAKNTDAERQTIFAWNSAASGDNKFVGFLVDSGGGLVGGISYNRTAGLVAYNTTSDYRAKDISGPVVDSGALIDSVPVYMGKMKGATQERPMFIAHEVPAYAQTGVKDAVDADGKPVYQHMDASALIPVMWAEIQSLRARLAAANI